MLKESRVTLACLYKNIRSCFSTMFCTATVKPKRWVPAYCIAHP